MREVVITSEELSRLHRLDLACATTFDVYDYSRWVRGVRTILGDRCPPVDYTETKLIVRDGPCVSALVFGADYHRIEMGKCYDAD